METKEIKQAPEITISGKPFDLKSKALQVPKYKFTPISPLSGANFQNMGVGGVAQVLFEIPPNVVNFSQSILSFTQTIADQGAGRFACSFQDTIGAIDQIQFYSRGKQMLIDIRDVHRYLKVVRPRETRRVDFLSADNSEAGLYRSELPAALNPIPVAALGSRTASENFTEEQYLRFSPAVGTGANGVGELDERIDFRLGSLLNTIFALNKDLAFNEVMVLRVVFKPDLVGFSTTSALTPTNTLDLASGSTSANSGAGGATTCVFLSGLTLYLACEQRPDVVEMRMSQLQKGGYEVRIPYVHVEQASLQGVNVSLETKLDSSHGQYLRKVITSVFPSDMKKENSFDNSNLPTTPYPAAPGNRFGRRVDTFVTRLDNMRLQEFDYRAIMDPAAGSANDYLDQKSQIAGSVINGRRQHYQNWAYCDSWLSESPATGMAPLDSIGGIDIHSKMRKYTFNAIRTGTGDAANAVAGAVGAQTYYCWFITSKVMKVGKNIITVE